MGLGIANDYRHHHLYCDIIFLINIQLYILSKATFHKMIKSYHNNLPPVCYGRMELGLYACYGRMGEEGDATSIHPYEDKMLR